MSRRLVLFWSFALIAIPALAERTPVLETKHFAIYSDFDTNLNDALINAGLAHGKSQPELFRVAGDEAACFEKLAPEVRAGWDSAVDFYARVISPGSFSSHAQFLIRMQLAGFEKEWRSDKRPEIVEIAKGMRAAAAPAYRACRWKAQDEKNHLWIADMEPRLARDEEKVAARLTDLYRYEWKKLPLIVDVVETVSWSGANTSWSDDEQGDILIANLPTGPSGFEVLFHESSHVLMNREAPVQEALRQAGERAAVRLPADLWHVVLFYTTGEAVRRILDAPGNPPYTPMLHEIYDRGSWAEYRDVLEKEWLPYVLGKRTLEEAAAKLVAALPAKK